LNKVFQHPDKEFCEVAIINDENEITYVHMTGIIDENSVQCHIPRIDITEHKLMEIEIKAKEVARLLLLLKLPFLAHTSHEIRTPLK
jgi:signal transduction histidine kinase